MRGTRQNQSLDAKADKALAMLAKRAAQPNDTSESVPAISNLITRAALAVDHCRDALLGPNIRGDYEPVSIQALLEGLAKDPGTQPRQKKTIRGIFFPAHLLYAGWWNRPERHNDPTSVQWRQTDSAFLNIRHWLNKGYELWGPSWDLRDPEATQHCLFGQIGSGDEADSLHIIIAPKAAAKLLERMENKLAVPVVARGTLYGENKEGLHETVRKALEEMGQEKPVSGAYIFVISDLNEGGMRSFDSIDIDVRDDTSIYSAYMWHCLAPRVKAHREIISRADVIFTWEHTNLLDKDCVKFNHESLMFKKNYLQRRVGELDILQQSYSLEDFLDQKFDKPIVTSSRLWAILNATHDIVHEEKIIPFRPRSREAPETK